jgi:excisionase family DNA binding protein
MTYEKQKLQGAGHQNDAIPNFFLPLPTHSLSNKKVLSTYNLKNYSLSQDWMLSLARSVNKDNNWDIRFHVQSTGKTQRNISNLNMTVWEMTMGPNRDVMNAEEVSGWLRIPKSTLYKLCSEGQIPCAKIGKHWRFDRAVMEGWFKRMVRERID